MNAIRAPKFNRSTPRSKLIKSAPNSAKPPENKTLFRGVRRTGSRTPKKDLGIALLLPMAYKRREEPLCAPRGYRGGARPDDNPLPGSVYTPQAGFRSQIAAAKTPPPFRS